MYHLGVIESNLLFLYYLRNYYKIDIKYIHDLENQHINIFYNQNGFYDKKIGKDIDINNILDSVVYNNYMEFMICTIKLLKFQWNIQISVKIKEFDNDILKNKFYAFIMQNNILYSDSDNNVILNNNSIKDQMQNKNILIIDNNINYKLPNNNFYLYDYKDYTNNNGPDDNILITCHKMSFFLLEFIKKNQIEYILMSQSPKTIVIMDLILKSKSNIPIVITDKYNLNNIIGIENNQPIKKILNKPIIYPNKTENQVYSVKPNKIALLLTGQLRTYELCKYIVKNMIIDKNNVDVFMSIDSNNSLQCLYENSTEITTDKSINDAINYFKPVNYFINYQDKYDIEYEKYIKSINKENVEKYMTIGSLKLVFEQYYIVHKAYEMLQNHINNTNQKYDIIMRLRFDQFIWDENNKDLIRDINKTANNKIIFDNINIDKIKSISFNRTFTFDPPLPNTINVFGCGKKSNYYYVNDQFFTHASDLIPIMMRFYKDIKLILNICSQPDQIFPKDGAYIEHIFYRFLKLYNVHINKSNFGGEFVRAIN